jgi:hypothetical protein
MNLKKRLADLERRFHAGSPIIAIFEDGSRQEIRLRPNEDVADLLQRIMNDPDSPEADTIRKSVAWIEPSGSKILELANAILNSPSGDASLDAVG